MTAYLKFKELHNQTQPLIIGNVWNVQSAKICEKLKSYINIKLKIKTMKKIMILFITIVTLFSCSIDNVNNEVKIRLSNVSQYNFKNIVVNTTTGNVNFEDLKPGQKSEYKAFDKAYRYAFVELKIDGKTYTLQPIDYVGETLLENGNYTYQIDANGTIDDRYTKLSLTLIED